MQRVTNQKKDGVAILLSNKLDLRAKKFPSLKSTLQNDRTNFPRAYNILNVYGPNNRASKYIKLKLMTLK